MSDERRLAYKDRSTNYLVSEISDPDSRTINDELGLTIESQFLVLEVTRDQFQKLFAAAMTGSDLVYPDESHDVLWPLWKAATLGTFCDAVAGCINNSEATQLAISNYFSNHDAGGYTGNADTPISTDLAEADMLPVEFECDRDHAFATSRAIVEAIHSATQEVMQAIDILTSPLEQAEQILDEIPLISLIGLALETVTWIKDVIFDLYEAAWSDSARDDIACEIFCVIVNDEPNCSISFAEVKTIYQNWAGFDDPPSETANAVAWFEWLYGLSLSVDVGTVKAGGLLGLLSMWFGAKFGAFDVGSRSLDTVIALAADETSNDWQILCEDCPEPGWHMVADLTLSSLPTFVSIEVGTHQIGVGVEMACVVGPIANEAKVRAVPGRAFSQRKMRLEYRYTLGTTAGSSINQAVFDGLDEGSYALWHVWEFGEVGTGYGSITHLAYGQVVTMSQYRLRASRNMCDGNGELIALHIWGLDDNPFLGEYGWSEIL